MGLNKFCIVAKETHPWLILCNMSFCERHALKTILHERGCILKGTLKARKKAPGEGETFTFYQEQLAEFRSHSPYDEARYLKLSQILDGLSQAAGLDEF
jgi:hypothetical protein